MQIKLKLFLFFTLIIFSVVARSEIKIAEGGVSGVSLFDHTEKRIYGGVAGLCPSPSSSSTCNTCTDTAGGLKPCNMSAVHSALTITFSFTSTIDLTGKRVYLKIGNATSKDNIIDVAGQAKDTPYSIQTTWGRFCLKMTNLPISFVDTNCNISGTTDVVSTGIHFYLGEDTTDTEIPVSFHGIPTDPTYTPTHFKQTFGAGNYGLYKYYFRAGDSKLILQEGESQSFSTFMPPNTPELYGIAYFLDRQETPSNPVDTTLFANGKNTIAVHPYNKTSGRLEKGPYIENLQNGYQYCVVTGQMNKTQNILAFTNDNVDSTVACATPNPVIGILEDKKCFISTAAFGSDMDDEVVLFRQFRDSVLLKTTAGNWFVKKYYKYSPPFADFIARTEILRAVARAGLYPFLGLAWLSLQIGFLPALFFAVLVLVGAFNFRKNLRWSFGK